MSRCVDTNALRQLSQNSYFSLTFSCQKGADIISARWNLTSSMLKKSEAKFKRKTRKQGQLLSESGFSLCIAPPSLSRDRIKMKKSSSRFHTSFVYHFDNSFLLFENRSSQKSITFESLFLKSLGVAMPGHCYTMVHLQMGRLYKGTTYPPYP